MSDICISFIYWVRFTTFDIFHSVQTIWGQC